MNHMIRPASLKQGDTIGICCPSGYMDRSKVMDAVQTFESWGLNVIIGQTVGAETSNYFAGTDEVRLLELQQMLDDPEIHAIMMGRGGYGMSRIIDRIDWAKFKQAPKWILGFSDITLLHNQLQGMGYMSVHSPMCAAFIPNEDPLHPEMINSVQHILFGQQHVRYPLEVHEQNRHGLGTGILVGGNLAMVTHAIGSSSQLNTSGTILFLEDVGEHLYKIDRMLLQLKRAGMLKDLAGLIYGQFSDAEDTTRPFGDSLENILLSHVAEYDYPVCLHFPAGHEDINFPLIMGAQHRLEIELDIVVFSEV